VHVHRDIISFALPNFFCINDNFTLTPNIIGGNFSGPGIIGYTLIALDAGVGQKEVEYTYYNNATNCTTHLTKNVEIFSAPTASLPATFYYCSNAGPLLLDFGTPTGGIYSGVGVSSENDKHYFNPAVSGVGTFEITYNISNSPYSSSSCSNYTSFNITVVSSIGSILGDDSICPTDAPVPLTGVPAGGVFSGKGVVGSTFDPLVSGSGTFTINYSIIDRTCLVNASTQIVVYNVPDPSVFGFEASHVIQVCKNGDPVLLLGSPLGGNLTGPNINDTTDQFIPSLVEPGKYDFEYSVLYSTGCIGRKLFSIIVNPSDIGSCYVEPLYNDTDFNNTFTDFNITVDQIFSPAVDSLPGWGVALIVIACVIVVATILLLVFFFVIKNRKDNLPEVLELSKINEDGSVVSIQASRDLNKSEAKGSGTNVKSQKILIKNSSLEKKSLFL